MTLMSWSCSATPHFLMEAFIKHFMSVILLDNLIYVISFNHFNASKLLPLCRKLGLRKVEELALTTQGVLIMQVVSSELRV